MLEDSPLSAKYYVESGYFDSDREKIFFRSWQCVCHVSEVAEAGDYASFTIIDENVFVVRDDDGQLHAYYNVCRHRGHPLVEGVGKRKRVLVCPYHAWTYGLDGSLLKAPGTTPGDKLSCDQIRLRSIRLEVFCGFVFVNLDDSAEALCDTLPEYEDNLRSFYPRIEELQFVCETDIQHHSNWKISVENYNECYHCPTVHGSSLTKGVLSMDGYTTIPRGNSIWHDGKAQTVNEKQYDYKLDAGARAGDYGAYWIWPNVSMCCYPGGYFTLRQWLPVSWNRTIYRYRWFASDAVRQEDVHALMVKHRETTGAEDREVVARVQKGMESRAFEPGPYVIGDGQGALSEVGLRHFHHLYRQALGEQP